MLNVAEAILNVTEAMLNVAEAMLKCYRGYDLQYTISRDAIASKYSPFQNHNFENGGFFKISKS